MMERPGHFPTNGLPLRMAFDGRNLWVTFTRPEGVSLFSPHNGAQTGKLKISGNPYGILYDGQSMWISNRRTDVVTKITRGN